MKHLLEIAQIVTQKKVRKIEIFDDHCLKQKKSKFKNFYELLMNGSLHTDQEAAQLIYDSCPKDDKYRQLKSRFKKRLLNTLFFLDVNQSVTSNYNRAYYNCHKDWTLVNILLSNRAEETGVQLSRNILSIALKFHFSDIIVNTTRILRQHASNTSNESAYEKYSKLCKRYNTILNAEIEAEEYFQRIVMWKKLPFHKLNHHLEVMKEHCAELYQLYQQHYSPVIFYNYFLASIFYQEALQHYEQVHELCLRVETHLKEHPHFYRVDQMAEVAQKKLLALLHLGDFKAGYTQAKHYTSIFEKHPAWLSILEYYLLLALHGQAYEKAHEIFRRVRSNKRFKKIKEQDKAKWNVFEAYLCFLHWFNAHNNNNKPKHYKQFKIKRFLEEPIIFSKQQRIFAIVIIAQVLFLLKQKNWDEAFERVEDLRNYASKLLKVEEHYRILQFIRLLQQLAKNHFDYDKIGVHLKYLDRLNNCSMHYRGTINGLEIIPYQHLWSMVLNLSKRQVAEH